ncbi:hypothetical protein FRX31_013262 [Thalictrum thalictroides]|uniref:Uncharacterized protein n=1 Tax=Thalictrum thalictroides TaxID=46969 RepID=A0A7J6WIF5_THATH|nr:hypothetical protein FRX31_013262 [Thalictrum thalictroides]
MATEQTNGSVVAANVSIDHVAAITMTLGTANIQVDLAVVAAIAAGQIPVPAGQNHAASVLPFEPKVGFDDYDNKLVAW